MKSAWFSNSWFEILTGTDSSWTWRSRRKGSSSVSWPGIELLLSVIFSPIAGRYRFNLGIFTNELYFHGFLYQIHHARDGEEFNQWRLLGGYEASKNNGLCKAWIWILKLYSSSCNTHTSSSKFEIIRTIIHEIYTEFYVYWYFVPSYIWKFIKYMMASCRSIKNYYL